MNRFELHTTFHMKPFIYSLCCFAWLTLEIVAAQEKTNLPGGTFLFDTFTQGKVVMKNKLATRALFNYDCVRQQLHFMDRNQEMILENTATIDTLYIGERKFIPRQTRFLECIPAGSTVLLVDWKAKIYNQGKKGAMGFVSQAGGIEKMDVGQMQNRGHDRTSNDVNIVKYTNTYFFSLDGKSKQFTSPKSFLKLFPQAHKDTLQAFYQEQSVRMEDPLSVARWVAYALSICTIP